MNELLEHDTGYYRIKSGLKGLCAGVAGRNINNINYGISSNEIRSGEKRILSGVTGVDSRNIVMLEQVHGSRIIHVVKEPSSDMPAAGEADGLITPLKGIMLVIRTADCVPVLLYDFSNEILGAVHSGWKGAMLDISGRCVEDMISLYGSDPRCIKAFILPSISAESYEVNDDVARHFPDNTIIKNDRKYVDLWGSVEDSLKRTGLTEENIFNPRICNRINYPDFFSHRYGDKGRNLNFAFMK